VTRQSLILRLFLEAMMLAVAVYFIIGSRDFVPAARYAPIFSAGLAAAALCVALIRETRRLVVTVRHGEQQFEQTIEYQSNDEAPVDGRYMLNGLRYVAWVVGSFGAILLLGTYISSVLFIALFLWFEAKRGALMVGISSLAVLSVLWVAAHELGTIWTVGLLTGV
jgi:hypothetical protein